MRTADWEIASSSTEHARMAHNASIHRWASWHEDLLEVHHLEGRLSGLKREGWGRNKQSRSTTNSAHVDWMLWLKLCLITVAVLGWGCSAKTSATELPTTDFSFDGNFLLSNLTVLGDAAVAVQETQEIQLNSHGANTNESSSGRVLYFRPVQLLSPATNSVASFRTSFSFTILVRENSSSLGDGFTFGFFPDATSLGAPGNFMGALPLANGTTSNKSTLSEPLSSGFNHTFFVEFDTDQDVEFGDPSDNHVGVNWNSMVSLNTTDLNSPAGLDLVEGNITAWIYYSYSSRTLSVWLTTSPVNFDPEVNQPVLEVGDLDLSQLLLPSMYVGFTGGIGAGDSEVHIISSWGFQSTFSEGPLSDLNPSSSRCCTRTWTAEREILLAVGLGVSVCLVAAGVYMFYLMRRKRQSKAGSEPYCILQKVNSTKSSSHQDRKLGGPYNFDSLRSEADLSPQASLRSKHSNLPRAKLQNSNPINSPVPASLGRKPSFQPATRGASLASSPSLYRMMSIPTIDNYPRFKLQSTRHCSAGSKRFATTQELAAVSSFGPRRYTYLELKRATRGFKVTLGEGGFGTVYKGYLRNCNGDRTIPVAVKQLAADSKQGEREFLAEVSIIAGLRHRNLVQMQGWCHDKGQMLLVHDYMENGSLNKHLHGKKPDDPVLPWDLRYKIMCQVASALMYLHEDAEQKVIHRDVKSSNVLLDAKFNARLGDFGLARVSEHSQMVDTSVLAGTMGYLAPEMVHTGKATTMTDVFSFGMLLLELVCGKKPLDCSRPVDRQLLGDWVWDRFEAGRLLDTVDPRLLAERAQNDEKKMIGCLHVALMCLHPDDSCRPPIRFARQMLVGDLALPTLPSHRPTLSFGSGPLRIHMEDLMESSMTFIALAMEGPYSKTTNPRRHNSASSQEFEAPWKLKVSNCDEEHPPGQSDSDSSNSFTSLQPSREPAAR